MKPAIMTPAMLIAVLVVTIAVVVVIVIVVVVIVIVVVVIVIVVTVVAVAVVAVVVTGRAGRVGAGPLVHIGRSDYLELGDDGFKRFLPALVVPVLAHGIRLPALHGGDEMVAEVVPGEQAALHQGHGHGEAPAFPRRVEDEFAVEPGRGGRPFDVERQSHRCLLSLR